MRAHVIWEAVCSPCRSFSSPSSLSMPLNPHDEANVVSWKEKMALICFFFLPGCAFGQLILCTSVRPHVCQSDSAVHVTERSALFVFEGEMMLQVLMFDFMLNVFYRHKAEIQEENLISGLLFSACRERKDLPADRRRQTNEDSVFSVCLTPQVDGEHTHTHTQLEKDG